MDWNCDSGAPMNVNPLKPVYSLLGAAFLPNAGAASAGGGQQGTPSSFEFNNLDQFLAASRALRESGSPDGASDDDSELTAFGQSPRGSAGQSPQFLSPMSSMPLNVLSPLHLPASVGGNGPVPRPGTPRPALKRSFAAAATMATIPAGASSAAYFASYGGAGAATEPLLGSRAPGALGAYANFSFAALPSPLAAEVADLDFEMPPASPAVPQLPASPPMLSLPPAAQLFLSPPHAASKAAAEAHADFTNVSLETLIGTSEMLGHGLDNRCADASASVMRCFTFQAVESGRCATITYFCLIYSILY